MFSDEGFSPIFTSEFESAEGRQIEGWGKSVENASHVLSEGT